MYDFQPRVPLDHVIELVGILRGTVERERGDILVLCGATLGEIGALLKTGLVVTNAYEVNDVEFQAEQLAATLDADPQFDITPWIPLILKIIELIVSRRG